MVSFIEQTTTANLWGCSSVVERSIRIRDARGSIPLISISILHHFSQLTIPEVNPL